jgi:hypothetical protein
MAPDANDPTDADVNQPRGADAAATDKYEDEVLDVLIVLKGDIVRREPLTLAEANALIRDLDDYDEVRQLGERQSRELLTGASGTA